MHEFNHQYIKSSRSKGQNAESGIAWLNFFGTVLMTWSNCFILMALFGVT